jgi:hypothetical protein
MLSKPSWTEKAKGEVRGPWKSVIETNRDSDIYHLVQIALGEIAEKFGRDKE